MGKFFKKLFWLATFSAFAYYGFKIYQKIKAIIGINKTLPQYLENIVDEKPKFSLNHNLLKTTIKIGFSQAVLDKEKDLENIVRDYIHDFYPALSSNKLDLEIYALTEEDNEKDTEEVTKEETEASQKGKESNIESPEEEKEELVPEEIQEDEKPTKKK